MLIRHKTRKQLTSLIFNVSPAQYLWAMEIEDFSTNENVELFLNDITGAHYNVVSTTGRYWNKEENYTNKGVFYNLQPVDTDQGFYDWYTLERKFNQAFKTKEVALIYFVKYWMKWNKLTKH